jgi:hypothetical protein
VGGGGYGNRVAVGTMVGGRDVTVSMSVGVGGGAVGVLGTLVLVRGTGVFDGSGFCVGAGGWVFVGRITGRVTVGRPGASVKVWVRVTVRLTEPVGLTVTGGVALESKVGVGETTAG